MSYNGKYISVIIPAAGMGKRMDMGINKQFIEIEKKPILAHTVQVFNNCNYIDEIILVVRKDEIPYTIEKVVNRYGFEKVNQVIAGGVERQHSVYNGLAAIDKCTDIVLIHDGARPCITQDGIKMGIEGVMEFRACVLGVPVKDTIKQVNDSSEVINTPDRNTLWAIQTPQCFEYNMIKSAYDKVLKENIPVTDDSMAVEILGQPVRVIMGSYENIKVTTKEDLDVVSKTLRR
ncbi:2-C-methyl-D-erythritol 4-phosphate cytidylyltransferase [Clostridiisalibacter paucivorans]|uniref:2-C-methyl-D-erythritol 4-phosphate cytidylyltransferase n=1 Tax=Clostridiisalibacter paucivorans TaxID=408753 RepID=UPI00047CF947|nr:2-C-methyl-D-erythritol 4-phosphate cytidylyltransferase [Clostridiisalibacter paucivorans]